MLSDLFGAIVRLAQAPHMPERRLGVRRLVGFLGDTAAMPRYLFCPCLRVACSVLLVGLSCVGGGALGCQSGGVVSERPEAKSGGGTIIFALRRSVSGTWAASVAFCDVVDVEFLGAVGWAGLGPPLSGRFVAKRDVGGEWLHRSG